MRNFLLGLGLFALMIAGLVAVLIGTGTINSSSLRMLLNVMLGISGPVASDTTLQNRYQVPDGFSLELYAADLPRARFMRFTSAGDLLVSRPHNGDIVLLRRDANGDGKPDATETLLSGLERPLGMDISGDWLYIAESNHIGRVLFDSTTGKLGGAYQPLVEGLTDNGNHWSKTIRIGPDHKLYLSQGSTCNVCVEADTRRATMMRFNLDGGEGETIATGMRNSVGFDWTPWSGELYATDNGRDMLGDDSPPCELNLIEPGKFYGWPYFNGDNVPDPDMGPDPQAGQRKPTAPAHDFHAHNAPLGLTFLNADNLPAQFQRSALAALHGSWNRSTPDGYKVVSLHWTDDGIVERDFLTGFNQNGEISGRPVDVAQGPDGAIYVSDDYAGAIYRVSYGRAANGRAANGRTTNGRATNGRATNGRATNGNAALRMPSTSRLDTQPPQWLADADLPAMANRGAALYQRYDCSSCHEQGTNPVRLEGLAARMGYAAVIEVLTAPQSPMPVFPLDDTQKRELAVFLLWQPPESE